MVLNNEMNLRDIPGTISLDVQENIVADLSIDVIDRVDSLIQDNPFKTQKELVGSIVFTDRIKETRREITFLIRMDSKLMLLNSLGALSLRRLSQEVLNQFLKVDSWLLSVYPASLDSLLRSVDTSEIVFARGGTYESWDPIDTEFEWVWLEDQPFVEAKFEFEDLQNMIYAARITENTIYILNEEESPNTLSAISQLLEKHFQRDLGFNHVEVSC